MTESIIHHFAIIPIEAITDQELTPAEYRLLSVLYSFRDKNANTVWPARDKIAERAGYTDETQVSKMISKLVKKEWVERAGKNGSWGAQKYRLTVPGRLQVQKSQSGQDAHSGFSDTCQSGQGTHIGGGQDSHNGQDAHIGQIDPSQGGQITHSGQDTHSGQNGSANVGVTPTANVGVLPTAIRTDQLSDQEHINYSEPKGSAANAGNPAQHSRLATIGKYYDSPDQDEESPTSLLFSLGVRTLGRYRIPEKQARSILGMYRRDHGDGPVMDAICEVFCRQPDGDPVGYIATILKAPRQSMPKDWAPNAGVVAQLEALGIKKSVINQARAFFKLWVLERDITSSDFDAWFTEWCIRDFEDSEADLNRMSGWYAPAAKSEFHEPAGGCIA